MFATHLNNSSYKRVLQVKMYSLLLLWGKCVATLREAFFVRLLMGRTFFILKGKYLLKESFMKRKILLTFMLAATLIALFAISVSAAEPVETWNVSATSSDSVAAYLYEHAENEGYYTLTISGSGNMDNWDFGSNLPPWHSSYQSKISSVTIEDGVTNIGSFAFRYCRSLTSIVIPNSVTSIGYQAFYYCTSLTSITIPSSVSSIGVDAFEFCYGINAVYINDIDAWCRISFGSNPLHYAKNLYLNGELVTDLEIPNSVTSIGNSAFAYCASLVSITIPNSVTSIGGGAFYNCTSLTSITIPNSVTSIGDGTFAYCASLTSITVEEGNEVYKSIDGNLYTYDGKTLCQYAVGKTDKSFVIPDSVTSIGNNAFYNCDSLTSVEIPDSVTSIGNNAFYSCDSLTSVEIPDSVTSIGDGAFAYCASLTSIVIPNSVTSIGNSAFYRSYNLTIYCEVESEPNGWNSSWNYFGGSVVWYYKNVMQGEIFTFKGYSFNEAGSIAVGFDIDYEAIALYEELTGEKLEIGVVFAGYELLNGQNPLDNQGNAISLAIGKVIKSDLSNYSYTSYDFMLTDVTDAIKDIPLVIAAYINNGQETKYVQANGISDTVTGISYNEAKENN